MDSQPWITTKLINQHRQDLAEQLRPDAPRKRMRWKWKARSRIRRSRAAAAGGPRIVRFGIERFRFLERPDRE